MYLVGLNIEIFYIAIYHHCQQWCSDPSLLSVVKCFISGVGFFFWNNSISIKETKTVEKFYLDALCLLAFSGQECLKKHVYTYSLFQQ